MAKNRLQNIESSLQYSSDHPIHRLAIVPSLTSSLLEPKSPIDNDPKTTSSSAALFLTIGTSESSNTTVFVFVFVAHTLASSHSFLFEDTAEVAVYGN